MIIFGHKILEPWLNILLIDTNVPAVPMLRELLPSFANTECLLFSLV